MDFMSIDQLMLISLLAGLVMLSKTRKQIVARNPKGYSQIAAGISLITFWGVISVLQNTIFKGEIVSAETEVMTEALMLVVALSGIVLLSSGMSYWLPITKKKLPQESPAQVTNIDSLVLTKLLLAGGATDEFITRLANWLLVSYELEQVDVLSVSNNYTHSSFVASAGSLDNLQLLPEPNLQKNAWYKDVKSRRVTKIDQSDSDDLTEQRMYGYVLKLPATENRSLLFVMWSYKSNLTELILPETIDILESGIAANLEQQSLILISDFTRNCDKKARQILNSVSSLINTNEIMSQTSKQFSELMPLDLMTLVSFNNGPESSRLTVGATATVLFETGVDIFESTQTYLTRISRTAITVMESKLTEKPLGYGTKMMAASGIRSLLAIPVYVQGRMQGIVTVGSKKTNAYTRRNLKMMTSAAPVFEFILSMIYGDQITQLVLRREKAISNFALDMTSNLRNSVDPFREAARLLYDYSDSDFVRISMIDKDASFLTSQVFVSRKPQKTLVPEKGHMILSLMPSHRSVIESGESLICDFASKLNEEVLSQCFAEKTKNALLIPIKSGSRVVGVISMAGSQDETSVKFDELTMQFGEMVSALLARYIEQSISDSPDSSRVEKKSVTTQGRIRQGIPIAGDSINSRKNDRLLPSAAKPVEKTNLVLTD